MARRLAAWLYTGPVGHVYAGALDLAGVVAYLARERRARRRDG